MARSLALGTWLAAGLVPVALGCGGRAATPVLAPVTAAALDEDLAITSDPIAIAGTVFVPGALAPPSMLLVHGPRKQSLDRLRAAAARSRADRHATLARRALDGQLVATALFEAARADAGKRAALLAEARQVIAAVRTAAGDATDEVTLTMGVALAFAADDAAGAEPYLSELSSRWPDRPGGLMAKTQLAYARLRDGEDAIAQALLGPLAADAAHPELAYVIAWVRFRFGDAPGAAAAITLALQGWTAAATTPALERDFLLMHARSGLPAATANDAVFAVANEPARRSALLAQLATGYGFAGRPDEARAALRFSLAALPAAPVAALPSVRVLEAEFLRRAGRLDEIPAAWRAAAGALAACTSCAAADRQALGDGLAARAVEAHTVFATSGDARYRALAAALYQQFDELPEVAARADRAQMTQYAADFGRVKAPDNGSQYADAIRPTLGLRQQEVQACYEATLQGAPTLGGALAVTLDVDGGGAVTGVATDPARGSAGLAQVAGCVEDRARDWRLPSRPRPGTARVTLRYVLGARP